MQQKEYSSVESGAQITDRKRFSWEDKYLALQFENQKLRKQFLKTGEAVAAAFSKCLHGGR